MGAVVARSHDPAHRAAEIAARYRAAMAEADDCVLALLALGVDPASAISSKIVDLTRAGR